MTEEIWARKSIIKLFFFFKGIIYNLEIDCFKIEFCRIKNVNRALNSSASLTLCMQTRGILFNVDFG